ncbi:MAG TPA: hypothetical protein VFG69_11955 [Nannocystaceae bacterium]|nr:hypothetical protein [Nannocystaceae bacterium]
MDARRERSLFRLLGTPDRLSRPEKEAILADVLATVEPRAAHARRSNWWAIVFACAVAAGLVLVIRPPSPTAFEDDAFSARGVGDAAPQLAILCGDRALERACAAGSELGFEAAALGELRHLSMYAKRSDGPVIWYLPATADGRSLALDREHETVLVDRRVTLGPEHLPGRYRLVAVFSAEPLDREQVKDAVRGHTPRSRDIAIVERELWVE